MFYQFRWNYLTNDSADYAFIVIDGTLTLLANSVSASHDLATGFFLRESGYQIFATTFGTSGPHYIGAAVVDTGDTTDMSALFWTVFL
jgi:hypothetical protein